MGCILTKTEDIPFDAPLQRYDFKQCRVISVYDGDTYTIVANHRNVFTKFPVRLYGVDTPELRGGTEASKKEAVAAKKYVESVILNRVVDCNILTNSENPINDKYGRLIINITVNNVSLAKDLIDRKLAKEYFGGTKCTS